MAWNVERCSTVCEMLFQMQTEMSLKADNQKPAGKLQQSTVRATLMLDPLRPERNKYFWSSFSPHGLFFYPLANTQTETNGTVNYKIRHTVAAFLDLISLWLTYGYIQGTYP